jgi:hypothetical protein
LSYDVCNQQTRFWQNEAKFSSDFNSARKNIRDKGSALLVNRRRLFRSSSLSTIAEKHFARRQPPFSTSPNGRREVRELHWIEVFPKAVSSACLRMTFRKRRSVKLSSAVHRVAHGRRLQNGTWSREVGPRVCVKTPAIALCVAGDMASPRFAIGVCFPYAR